MSPRRPTGARPVAAPLVVGLPFAVAALTGCSGSSPSPRAADCASRPPPPVAALLSAVAALTGGSASSPSRGAADGASRTPSSPSASPSIDPAGLRVLARAERGLVGTHSYSFTADTTLAASSTLRTQL